MEKKNFITLVLGIVSGLVFALGMCMCLLPEWNMFNIGVGCTAVGFVAGKTEIKEEYAKTGRVEME